MKHSIRVMFLIHIWLTKEFRVMSLLRIHLNIMECFERWNRYLCEAAGTMHNFENLLQCYLAEAILATCFTQNRSFIRYRFNITPYEIINKRKQKNKISPRNVQHNFQLLLCYTCWSFSFLETNSCWESKWLWSNAYVWYWLCNIPIIPQTFSFLI